MRAKRINKVCFIRIFTVDLVAHTNYVLWVSSMAKKGAESWGEIQQRAKSSDVGKNVVLSFSLNSDSTGSLEQSKWTKLCTIKFPSNVLGPPEGESKKKKWPKRTCQHIQHYRRDRIKVFLFSMLLISIDFNFSTNISLFLFHNEKFDRPTHQVNSTTDRRWYFFNWKKREHFSVWNVEFFSVSEREDVKHDEDLLMRLRLSSVHNRWNRRLQPLFIHSTEWQKILFMVHPPHPEFAWKIAEHLVGVGVFNFKIAPVALLNTV